MLGYLPRYHVRLHLSLWNFLSDLSKDLNCFPIFYLKVKLFRYRSQVISAVCRPQKQRTDGHLDSGTRARRKIWRTWELSDASLNMMPRWTLPYSHCIFQEERAHSSWAVWSIHGWRKYSLAQCTNRYKHLRNRLALHLSRQTPF